MKQNLFADLDDCMTDPRNEGMWGGAFVLVMIAVFAVAWIASSSFWGALILSIVAAPMMAVLGGAALIVLTSRAFMFAGREGKRIGNFLFGLPFVVMFGVPLYFLYLLISTL